MCHGSQGGFMRDSLGASSLENCWVTGSQQNLYDLFDHGREPQMTTKALSRRSKAITLVPLALLSGVWTASLVNSSATASDNAAASALPDGTTVPNQAIEAPASVPPPGVLANAVPEGAADSVVSGA